MTLQITTIPGPVPDPSLSDAAWVAAMNQMANDMTPFASELNAVAVEVNTNATDAGTAKTGAQTAQTAAESARDAALGAATAIAADYNPSSFAYVKNALAWDGPNALYRCILGYTSGTTTPASDPTHWARVNLTPADLAALSSAIDAARDLLVNVKSAAYTLALSDRATNVQTTAPITIPAAATVAFPAGALVVITNTSASAITITPAAGVTLRFAGSAGTGARTLAGYGKASLTREGADLWFAAGSGLS